MVLLQGGLRWIRAWAACDPEFLLILDRRFLRRMTCVLQSCAECCASMAAACLCRTCVTMHVLQNALHSMDIWKRVECLERRAYSRFGERDDSYIGERDDSYIEKERERRLIYGRERRHFRRQRISTRTPY